MSTHAPRATRVREGNHVAQRPSADTSPFALIAILVSPPLLLTARVTPGTKVNVFSLDAPKLPPGVPSLRHAELAQTVRVKEVFDGKRAAISTASTSSSSKSPDAGKGKRRDWLALLIRESLSAFSSSLAAQPY